MTRKQYFDAKDQAKAHREYYAQFVGPYLFGRLVVTFGRETLVAAYKADRHLNTIPLRRWDAIVPVFPAHIHAEMKACGDYMTQAGAVCILKEAAIQIAEGKV